ncbi:MAG TPA: hypothetical protein P5121_26245, partial [Caldilineaceae bacterium]|nr:hypothetical protein [Caldilineaceae bacterium]
SGVIDHSIIFKKDNLMQRVLPSSFISIVIVIMLWIPATAQSVLTADEQEYVNAILVIMESYSEASTVLATQFTDLGSDISLLIDAEWRMDTIIGLALYKYAALSTHKLSPPPKFAAIHTKLKAIADEALAAVDALSYGMDNIDADSIKKGSDHVTQAGQLMGEA